jgi:hypothetical protein
MEFTAIPHVTSSATETTTGLAPAMAGTGLSEGQIFGNTAPSIP